MTVAAPTLVPAPRNRAHTPARRAPHGATRRRAAASLLIGLAVTFGTQAGVGWAVAKNSEALSDPLYHDKRELLRAHPVGDAARHERPLTLLFLGSSRTYDAINAGAAGAELTRALGRSVAAFNFATSGAGPITLALYLRRLFAEGVRPDAVVIEVHPAFLAAQVSPPFESRWLKPIRLRPEEVDLVREFGFPVEVPAAHGLRERLFAGYEFRVHLLERYAPAFSPLPYRLGIGAETDRHGFVRVPEFSERQRAKLRVWTREQYAPCWRDYAPGGSGQLALRDALETCRAAGVRATLLLTPESMEFKNWYPEPGRSRIAPVVRQIAHEFGAPVVDARDWLSDERFADGHHLTGAGADAFTGRLVRDALAPWLRASVVGGAL